MVQILHPSRVFAVLLVLGLATSPVWGQDADADFFEKRVRPVLAEHCWKCHGPTKQRGGVRLDGPAFLKQSSDGGDPVVVPGQPDKSRLIRALRHDGDVHMPPAPSAKLPAGVIADLTRWVARGAVWPGAAAVKATPATSRHWAFQPLGPVAVPKVKDAAWATTTLDRFILARLEAQGLTPSAPADRRTLLRRVTFDLTGLPPTPAELDAFVNDDAPDAFAEVVDRLLASPAYGERWGRHWLDVARFADGRGPGTDSSLAVGASYRAWVIRAFNDDMPYSTFVLKQVAADQLGLAADHRDLAALGFLTLGRAFDGNADDVVDDRLDVIFRGLQGLTVTCARCHDHKYDPISIRDYYSLFGVLAGATDKEVPVCDDEAGRARYQAWAKELKHRRRLLQHFIDAERSVCLGPYRQSADRYLLAARQPDPKVESGDRRPDGLSTYVLTRWRNLLNETRDEFHPVLTPWHAFAKLPADRFAIEAPQLAKRFAVNKTKDKQLNEHVAKLFAGKPPASLAEIASRYGLLFARIDRAWQGKLAEADRKDEDPPGGLDDGAEEEIRQLFYGDGPLEAPLDELRDLLAEPRQKEYDALQDAVNQWRSRPDAPPHALVLQDPAEPEAPRVFLRGKRDTPGDVVPRQFLAVLAGPTRQPFTHGTGRLELARALTARSNPLTARVWVNRVWLHHFGQGLVRTPSDFGLRGEPPSHPELLDWLALRFLQDGGSTKQLHRLILLSQTYRQASAERPAARLIDPDNRLLWRMHRRRLEIEALRDALLAVAGNLEPHAGGRPVRLADEPLSRRRTVYLEINREELPGLLRVFDFANPDLHVPRRHETIVPQQALFLLNSPLVAHQARVLAKRIDGLAPPDSRAWIRQAYLLTLGRDPEPAETELGRAFLSKSAAVKQRGPAPPAEVWQYGYGRWDEAAQRVAGFARLPHFADNAWQGGKTLPDPKLSWLMLTADGGHPGEGLGQVVVRRWLAPRAGVVSIDSTLTHPNNDGDGVRGQVVARSGVLKAAVAFNSATPISVRDVQVAAGDTIDFVVDCRTNLDNDSFTWPVVLTLRTPGQDDQTVRSTDDFRGPAPTVQPLSPREQLAQVLLMANEFQYVD